MASTITQIADAPGKLARRVVRGMGARQIVLGVYNVAFGNPYVVGGEDISAIFNDFAEVVAIIPIPSDATIADNRVVIPVLATKKLILNTALNTESGAVDQTAVDKVRLLVVGY